MTWGHALARRSGVVQGLVHAVVPSAVRDRVGTWEVRWPVEGFQLCLPHRLQSLYEATWEPGTVAYLKQALRPGMTAVDVGANIGGLTLVMARSVGPQGRVIAVEPGPQSLRWLRRNVARNGAENVIVVDAAAGARTERRSFNVEENLVLGSFYAHPWVQWGWTVDVHQTTLDQLAPDVVDLVKIDVEGAELEVLQGAPRLLASGPRLIVEWWPYGLIHCGHSPTALLSALVDFGYDVALIDDRRRADGTFGTSLEELADRAEARTLSPGWYVNLACERP